MKIWIYLDGRQQGPFDSENLGDITIEATTPVWYEGLDRWKPAGLCPELASTVGKSVGNGTLSAENPAESGNTEEKTGSMENATQSARPAPAPAPRRPAPAPAPAAAAISRDNECPPTYIGWAIFLTICCCSPLSIGALIASIVVGTAWNAGRHSQARKASQWAAWLIMTSIALGFLPMMLIGALLPG